MPTKKATAPTGKSTASPKPAARTASAKSNTAKAPAKTAKPAAAQKTAAKAVAKKSVAKKTTAAKTAAPKAVGKKTTTAKAAPAKTAAKKAAPVKAPVKVPVKASVKASVKAPPPMAVKTPKSPKPAVVAKIGRPEQLKMMIEKSLDDDKADEIVALDLVGKSSLTDYVIIATGNSARQVTAMAEHLCDKIDAMGKKPHVEGLSQGDWVLIDAGDVIVHLFRPEVRAFYQLERLWAPETLHADAGV